MDIDLLSRMVKELILENDEVTLPGVGSFVAEFIPSTFSDKGFTINPPYRKLVFRKKISKDNALLCSMYARENSVDETVAEEILTEFLKDLHDTLLKKKVVVMPGLGRLRATKENVVFFVTDEDLDIYPAGFGLEPVSLKSHLETKEEVSAEVVELKAIIEDCGTEKAVTQERETDRVRESEKAKTSEIEKRPRSWAKVVVISIVCTVVAAVAAFFALANFAPDVMDSILYTPEELEIIHHTFLPGF